MLKSFYLSFYSSALYCDVAQNWRGYLLSLLFTVTVFHAAVYAICFHREYQAFAAKDVPALLAQTPNITVLDGQIRIDRSWPNEIKNNKGNVLVKFDTLYKEEQHLAGQVWFTGSTIYIRPPYGDVYAYSVSNIKQMEVSKASLESFFTATGKWFLPAIFLCVSILMFMYHLFQLALFTAWGMFLNRIIGSFLSVPQIVRICVVAMIPVLYTDAFLLFLKYGEWDWVSLSTFALGVAHGVIDPVYGWIAVKSMLDPVGWPWISFFLFSGYLVFAMRANRALLR